LEGLPEIFSCLKRFRRANITIRIGKPIGPFASSARGRAGRSELDDVGDTILRAIAELLPPDVRGVYSDDPKLRQEAEASAEYPWKNGKFAPRKTNPKASEDEAKGAS